MLLLFDTLYNFFSYHVAWYISSPYLYTCLYTQSQVSLPKFLSANTAMYVLHRVVAGSILTGDWIDQSIGLNRIGSIRSVRSYFALNLIRIDSHEHCGMPA